MKLIHLSDLHLGKRIYGFSMMEDQKYILNQILEVIKRERADGVILAGDLYDKSIPSAEAVRLFDWFLTSLADMKLSVFAISGNHDSAERIAFGADLMNEKKVYLSPVYDGIVRKIEIEDEYGPVCIWLLPFLKPVNVRQALKEEKIEGYQDALENVLCRIDLDEGKRNVLVAHQFVTGASLCDSEELNVGGLDQISAETFKAFDYVALGHIHSPQKVGTDTIRYCGTPLSYSFSEAGQTKSVTVIELKKKGSIEIRLIPLKPLRKMRTLKGSYMELMHASSCEDSNREDYVHITLTDEEDIPDGLQKLRIVYPNLMQLSYDNQRTQEDREITVSEMAEHKSEMELFEEFFEIQNNQNMSAEQKDFVAGLIEKLQQ